MNGEPRTDLIQLITRTESLSGDDDSRAARPTLIRRVDYVVAAGQRNFGQVDSYAPSHGLDTNRSWLTPMCFEGVDGSSSV